MLSSFLTVRLVGLRVQRDLMAPSSWLNFPRGWFRQFPCIWQTYAAAWLVRTPGQNLWVDPPVGVVILVPSPWRSNFSRLCPRRCIFETALGFVRNFQFRALVLGRSLCSVGSRMGCAVAQMRILSVPCTPWSSFLALGVRAVLLQGSTPRTPHSHLLIDVSRSNLLLLVLRRTLEGWALGYTWGLPQCCSLPPPCLRTLLLGLTTGSSLGKIRLIC